MTDTHTEALVERVARAMQQACKECGGDRISFAYAEAAMRSTLAPLIEALPARNDETDETLRLEWREGAPPKPWGEEWFIALTTYGDRVALKALPDGYAYDFKTADETYIKRDVIAKWMQFPDSEYIAPARNDERALKLVEALTDIRNRILCPVGPSPSLDEIGEIASTALADTQPSGETR